MLKGKTVSSVLQANEGGYWFTTTEDGVFYAQSLEIDSWWFDDEEKLTINVLASVGENILVGAKNGGIKKLKRKQNGFEEKDIEGFWEVYALTNLTDSLVAVYSRKPGAAGLSPTAQVTARDENLKFVHAIYLSPTEEEGVYWKAAWGRVGKGSLSDSSIFKTKSFMEIRITSLYYDSKKRVWVGCNLGLFEFLDREMVSHQQDHEAFTYRITDITELDSNLIFATQGMGILVETKAGRTVIDRSHGLVNNMVRTLYKENDSILWVGTRKGISRIHFSSIDPLKFSIRNILMTDGLPSGQINDLLVNNGSVWSATTSGLARFSSQFDFTNYTPPPILITGAEVNEKRVSHTEPLELNHDENDLALSFVGLSYRSKGDINYRYRIKELDEKWSETQARQVRYPALPPGEYTFEVLAQNSNGIWSKAPAMMQFTILRPFWATWWFISGVILLFFGLTWAAFNIRYRIQRDRMELKQRSLESEQRALRAQMTPHFMFNALNSIQLLIANNERIFAVTNVAKFARLMRNILSNSNHAFISLAKEIQSLELYLELESLRFKGKFTYEIDVGDSVDSEIIKIPPMLIQPFVENAIWHGIMKKEEPGGRVELHLEREGDLLICWVTDDGIGRAKAAELAQKQLKTHESLGMKITTDRVKNINQQLGTKMEVKIEDLTDNQGNPSGTRVILHIPI